MRIGRPEPRTARNELRAIKKLCDGTHRNIIKVFEFGDLPDGSHAFIDMELCSLNLDQYNKSIRTTILVHPLASNMRIGEIWSIITQIADGLAFIHGHHEIHRDLKPQNGLFPFRASVSNKKVLYSTVDRVWKIADFGLTSEGTSQSLHNTETSRGTPGYRAPELLREDRAAYNNKVDIWALGCILYELVVGTKPFATDIAVLEHYQITSSLNITLDDTIDPVLITLLSKAIDKMLHYDPSSRPTAATLLDTFSVHGLTAMRQNIRVQPNEGSLINPLDEHRADVVGDLPIFRKLHTPEGVIAATSELIDQLEWTIIFVVINASNTRIATVSCDADREHSPVTLWDAASGKCLWRRQYPWNGIHKRANPAFSSDGKYFGVHHGDQAVEIFDAESTKLVKTVGIHSEEQIAAIALSRNGKGVAVALDGRFLDVPTLEGVMAKLNDIEGDVSSNVDIIQTRGVSGISLAYDPRGRYLFLVGNSTSRDVIARSARVGFYWDVINRSIPEFFREESLTVSSWNTPLYNMPSHNSVVCRCFSARGTFWVDTYGFIGNSRTILSFKQYAVCSFNNRFLLVLGNDVDFDLWDEAQFKWLSKQDRTRTDSSNTIIYKYLLRYEGKGVENVGAEAGTKFVAKILWDNMPPLTEVKGMAETEAGLTLILEGEKFMFFSNKPSVITSA